MSAPVEDTASVPCVMVIDDEQAVREAIRFLLESRAIAVRDFGSGEDFLQWWDGMPHAPAGCVMLDVRMQQMSGLEVHDALRARRAMNPIIFLTGHGDIPMAVEALKRGAFYFLEKPSNDNSLVDLIDRALARDAAQRQEILAREAFEARSASLSPRERELLELIVVGRLNKQIAGDLGIAVRTVEVVRAKVFEKMGVRSSAELATLVEKHRAIPTA
jgi:two-component system, LuxR family, response regulator DctR